LVRTCKSIIQQEDEQDYIEIEELILSTAQLQVNSSQNEVGIPNSDIPKAGVESQAAATTNRDMGQSLRKPKISLTWVLREQAQQQPKTSNTSNNNNKTWGSSASEKIAGERKKPRSRSKSNERNERHLNKEYLSEKSLKDETASHKSSTSHRKKTDRIERKNGKVLKKSSCSNRFNENCCNKSNSSNDAYDNLKNSPPFYNENGTKLTASVSHINLSSKNTYSEPSIYQSVSESGQLRRQRRRKRHRSPKFGYEIKNVDEFLSKVRPKKVLFLKPI
jgi:hypothetical protein